MKTAPLVSVIIPYYNSDAYFSDLLESISAQTIQDIEIIIIDDKSKPESVTKLQEMIQSYSHLKIQIITNSVNMGVAATRNLGFSVASGIYISYIDGDDLLCGKFSLEYRIHFLENNPDFSGIGGYAYKINPNGKALFVGQEKTTEHFREAVMHPENLRNIYAQNVLNNTAEGDSASALFFATGSCLFRKQELDNFPFDPHYESEDDIEWLLRFLDKKKIKLEILPFHCRRVHAAQYHNRTPSKTTQEIIQLCKKIVG